jgi:hypothetical protein
LHHRLLTLEETLRLLLKKDGASLNKEIIEKIKVLQGEVQSINEILYTDIKKAKIS